MDKDTLELSTTIAASAQKVWGTLIHVDQWWGGVILDAKLGGAFRETWQEDGKEKRAEGSVIACSPGKELAISWSEPEWPEPMTFTFTLESSGAKQTNVTLTEQGWSAFPDAIRYELKNAHTQGWRHHLHALRAAAES